MCPPFPNSFVDCQRLCKNFVKKITWYAWCIRIALCGRHLNLLFWGHGKCSFIHVYCIALCIGTSEKKLEGKNVMRCMSSFESIQYILYLKQIYEILIVFELILYSSDDIIKFPLAFNLMNLIIFKCFVPVFFIQFNWIVYILTVYVKFFETKVEIRCSLMNKHSSWSIPFHRSSRRSCKKVNNWRIM